MNRRPRNRLGERPRELSVPGMTMGASADLRIHQTEDERRRRSGACVLDWLNRNRVVDPVI